MKFISSKKIEDEFIQSIRCISDFVILLKKSRKPEAQLEEVRNKTKTLREEIIGLKSSLPSIEDLKAKEVITQIIEEKEEAVNQNHKLEVELQREYNSYLPEITEYSKYVHHIAQTYTSLLDYELYKCIADDHFNLPYEFEAYALCMSDVKSKYGKHINLRLEGRTKRYKILQEANKGFDSFIEWLKQN